MGLLHFIYLSSMKIQALEPQEQLYLRSRMIFALALSLVFLALGILSAFQIMVAGSDMRYAWMAGLILALALTFGALRVVLRLLRDLRSGEKQVVLGRIGLLQVKGRRAFVKVGDQSFHISSGLASNFKKGDQVSICMSRSGVFLSIREEAVKKKTPS